MIAVRSSAKLNLTLEILGRRPDGYHEIRSVVQTVGLWDDLVLRPSTGASTLSCNLPELETPDNLCLRAAEVLARSADVQRHAEIQLTKRIPAGAGLGGGSGNAAATLVGLNELWGLQLPRERLAEVAATLGADVPLFLTGGALLMEGIGDRLSPLGVPVQCSFVIAKGASAVSTAWAYEQYDREPLAPTGSTEEVVRWLRAKRVDKAAAMFDNVMEPAIVEAFPEVSEVKEALIRHGALGAALSGSGSAVFGVFDSRERATDACDCISSTVERACVVDPTPLGVQVLPSSGTC